MQSAYFSLWLGKWPSAIDWTAAVAGTHLSEALDSFSIALSLLPSEISSPGPISETDPNLDLNSTPQPATLIPETSLQTIFAKYLPHLTITHYTQDAFSLRLEAYDDMLWVVLQWLSAVSTLTSHSARHHNGTWHATQFVPAFAHRARIFYELAAAGWDTALCGGGMLWSPRGLPYKNAVTNELFVAASVGMYLGWPGDANCEPFLAEGEGVDGGVGGDKVEEGECDIPRETFLANALGAYEWLSASGMRNSEGLFTDGFHISGYEQNHSRTACDERSEDVWTYNQGILLSGLRGLWEATGNESYLDDGHALVESVIRATYGGVLGEGGVLTERCDVAGSCSQDGQTFKGIFFQHLGVFCGEVGMGRGGLAEGWVGTDKRAEDEGWAGSKERAEQDGRLGRQINPPPIPPSHLTSCSTYTPWISRNAATALSTRDEEGRFGMWWGAPYLPPPSTEPNARGRGRTLETQMGGLAVVRARWEFLRLYGEGGE